MKKKAVKKSGAKKATKSKSNVCSCGSGMACNDCCKC